MVLIARAARQGRRAIGIGLLSGLRRLGLLRLIGIGPRDGRYSLAGSGSYTSG